jgi:hypothetical protein
MAKKEVYKEVFDFMKEKNIQMNDRMFIRNSFQEVYENEYPFIEIKYNKGEIEYYKSKIKEISNLGFKTENEVILANAIYENIKEHFNPNEFIQILKFTFRIMNIKSEWSE